MRAIIEENHGGPEVLRVSEIPAPVPRSREVLIRVRAAGINRADALQRRGFYPPPPGSSSIYGLEVAGEIEAVGEGASVENCGRPVMALLPGGGYADYVTVPVDLLLPKPENLSFEEAAALPEVAATVYSNLVLTCGMSMDPAENLREDGQSATVLVHGGTGGIGVHAIQVALAAGTRVFATVGTEEKAEYVRSLGAEPIVYREHSFRDVVLSETGAARTTSWTSWAGGTLRITCTPSPTVGTCASSGCRADERPSWISRTHSRTGFRCTPRACAAAPRPRRPRFCAACASRSSRWSSRVASAWVLIRYSPWRPRPRRTSTLIPVCTAARWCYGSIRQVSVGCGENLVAALRET